MKYLQTFESFISESSQRIYLNKKISDFFELPYANDGEKTIINTDALLRDPVLKMADGWDTNHKEIFKKHKGDLKLKGDGYGWWTITEAEKLNGMKLKK